MNLIRLISENGSYINGFFLLMLELYINTEDLSLYIYIKCSISAITTSAITTY